MDKRYLLIVFITLICGINMYIISENSDFIGSASVNFDRYTISLPQNYVLIKSETSFIQIFNSNLGYLAIEHKNVNYSNDESVLKAIGIPNNRTILSNGTITANNITLNSMFLKTMNDRGNETDRAIFYFNKFNTTFIISMSGFNQDTDNKEVIDIASKIAASLRINYKI